jgi:predicted phosphohydrolase
MAPLGKSLVLLGLVLVVAGASVWASSSVPFLGRLPGDIYIRRGNFSFYFPLTTCVLVSALLSLLFFALRR